MLFGQLYTCLPPKWLYVASVVVFEVGSALCGAAPDMTSLIVGRAVCGLGGIGMYVGVMALLAGGSGRSGGAVRTVAYGGSCATRAAGRR